MKFVVLSIILLVLLASLIMFGRGQLVGLMHKFKNSMQEAQTIGNVAESNNYVLAVQHFLQETGYKSVTLDGKLGQKTRTAIAEFQKLKGLKSTGMIDQSTKRLFDKEMALREKFSGISLRLDKNSDWRPLAVNASDAPATKVSTASRNAQSEDEVLSYRLNAKNKTIQAQAVLKKAGLYQGDIDGKLGSQTKKAIEDFQKSKGFACDGRLEGKTWEELQMLFQN